MLFIPISTAAHATTLLVVDAGGGGDFTTIEDALDAAPDDVEIDVRAGTYDLTRLAYWGGDNLTLAGDGADVVTVTRSAGGDLMWIDGMVTASVSGMAFRGNDTDDGLYIGDGAFAVSSCLFEDFYRALQFWDNTTVEVTDTTFASNRIAIFYDYDPTFIGVADSVFIDDEWGIGYSFPDIDRQEADLDIRNNTFVRGVAHLYVCEPEYGSIVVEDNLFVGATYDPVFCGGAYGYDDPTTWIVDNNLFWDNAEASGYGRDGWGTYLESDPQFVAVSDDGDWTNDDLHLNAGSPAIDAATGTTVLLDYDGVVRPLDGDGDGTVVADLGAYEWYRDDDGDGFVDASIGGDDCDDGDATEFPSAPEVCDGDDDDCDGTTDEADAVGAAAWYADADGDGYGDATVTSVACDDPVGYVADATDCDDADAGANPGAIEAWYDGTDQDCDGRDDDQDGDGFLLADDCDDTRAEVNPDATDTRYDGIDADCAGDSDYDADADGHDSASFGGDDCDDADAATYPGAPDAPYDGVVNDCDAAGEYDADGDGHDAVAFGGDDCDDARSDVNTDAVEVWYDGVDQDCDGRDDDQDGDGFGSADDCDDTRAEVNPAAAEVWYDGVDQDCDGRDDDQDGDGFGLADDCDDTDASRNVDCSPAETGDTAGDTGRTDTGSRDTAVETGGVDAGPVHEDDTADGTPDVHAGDCGCANGGGAGTGGWLLGAGLLLRRRSAR